MDELTDEDVVLGIIGLGFMLVFLVAYILFLVAQQNTLRSIKPHNQKMPPGQVWLQLIPLFNIVWQFVVVARVADSIRAEIDDRISTSFLGEAEPIFINDKRRRPTYDIGLATCILSLLWVLPLLDSFVFLGWLVCWIVYWSQMAQYKNKFQRHPW